LERADATANLQFSWVQSSMPSGGAGKARATSGFPLQCWLSNEPEACCAPERETW